MICGNGAQSEWHTNTTATGSSRVPNSEEKNRDSLADSLVPLRTDGLPMLPALLSIFATWFIPRCMSELRTVGLCPHDFNQTSKATFDSWVTKPRIF